MKTVAFFNNKGGVGKTSLVYHLAWMFAINGISTLAIDLDPQANLTSMFLDDERLEELFENKKSTTVYNLLDPLIGGRGDISEPHIEKIHDHLGLIPGSLGLSSFEDQLSENWSKCLDEREAAFRIETAFYRIIGNAATQQNAEIILIDVGPNLGAINRSALISAEYVVIPLASDLFSLQGLKNLGPALRKWRKEWQERIAKKPYDLNIPMPSGNIQPIGYVAMQHSIRGNSPVKSYVRWLNLVPKVYREFILNEQLSPDEKLPLPEEDEYNLALLKHYRSLMPLAMEAHKPMFSLTSADGVVGAHVEAVLACYEDFLKLAKKIGTFANVSIS